MPLYEYECSQCGHAFEAVQKAGAPPLKKCPKCAGPLRKLLSAPAIHFKGSGWYVTDYAKKTSDGTDKPQANKSEAAGAPKAADAKDAKKGDGPSKP